MSCLPRDDQTSNCSMHMNLSTDSSEHFLLELSSLKSQQEYTVASGITKETLNELELQQSHKQTNGHGSEMMRYLQDTNASEAFAVGGDELMVASNKETAITVKLKAWEVRFEELSTKEDEKRENGRATEDRRSPQAKAE